MLAHITYILRKSAIYNAYIILCCGIQCHLNPTETCSKCCILHRAYAHTKLYQSIALICCDTRGDTLSPDEHKTLGVRLRSCRRSGAWRLHIHRFVCTISVDENAVCCLAPLSVRLFRKCTQCQDDDNNDDGAVFVFEERPNNVCPNNNGNYIYHLYIVIVQMYMHERP